MNIWNQTVTVYRKQADQIRRNVYTGCCYQWHVEQTTDAWGTREQTKFLLVIPGDVPLAAGDRVYEGEGPEITHNEWAAFIPVNVPGLGQIEYVRPCRWNDRIRHTEAGRK